MLLPGDGASTVEAEIAKRIRDKFMAQWQLEPKPSAVLTAVDPEPLDRGDGAKVQRWKTAQGAIHAQVIYPNHRIEWYLQVKA